MIVIMSAGDAQDAEDAQDIVILRKQYFLEGLPGVIEAAAVGYVQPTHGDK